MAAVVGSLNQGGLGGGVPQEGVMEAMVQALEISSGSGGNQGGGGGGSSSGTSFPAEGMMPFNVQLPVCP